MATTRSSSLRKDKAGDDEILSYFNSGVFKSTLIDVVINAFKEEAFKIVLKNIVDEAVATVVGPLWSH